MLPKFLPLGKTRGNTDNNCIAEGLRALSGSGLVLDTDKTIDNMVICRILEWYLHNGTLKMLQISLSTQKLCGYPRIMDEGQTRLVLLFKRLMLYD